MLWLCIVVFGCASFCQIPIKLWNITPFLRFVTLPWLIRWAGKCAWESEAVRGGGQWMEGADGWRTKDSDKTRDRDCISKHAQLSIFLQTCYYTHIYIISHSFMSTVPMATYSVFWKRLLQLSVCVCVSLSVCLARQGVTLMTCICGNTSGSVINTHQLGKQFIAPVYNDGVCVSWVGGSVWLWNWVIISRDLVLLLKATSWIRPLAAVDSLWHSLSMADCTTDV